VAQTVDVIADRVRSILVASPFTFAESPSPFSFDLAPDGTVDQCFRVGDRGAQRVIGGFNYSETRVDLIEVWVARKFHGEPTTARRLLARDMASISAAIVRDGHEDGGDYAVEDEGRAHEIRVEAGAEFAVLQMRVPVNYESQL
jgi:hypothetical protein